ncbi:SIMPL domain-containing protein [Streptomyces sp. MRC013]|uniref:SIMPL domain-containing protein n=1 Tax=Streptomyces sp. MRC013 TaxID=2898276 RepID=UPI0020260C75|nr:SIMPL domain-containing protein [Streptomyces sp. MRC013]URM91758.1 SIMPL domain-containing protein [Streptomyces sp. MRC013]
MTTPPTPHITVRGEGHVETAPDLARIDITLTARGTDRHTTLTDLTQRNTTALNLIRSYGSAIDTLETSTLTLTPELTPHSRNEHIHTHHGTVHLTTTLTDFAPLGELITRLAALDLTRIDGPWWTLRPTSPAHTQARRQAVEDAVHRARDYAHALGTELDALLQLDDTAPDHPLFPSPTLRTAHATESTQTPPPLDLQPQRQTATAHITARFTLHPPTLRSAEHQPPGHPTTANR